MRGASQVVSHNGAGPVHPATAMPIGARPARFDFMKWLDILKVLALCSTAFAAVFMWGFFWGWRRGYANAAKDYQWKIEQLVDESK